MTDIIKKADDEAKNALKRKASIAKKALNKLGINQAILSKKFEDLKSIGLDVKTNLHQYPKSIAFIGKARVDEIFQMSMAYSSVKLYRNVILIDPWQSVEWSKENRLESMAETSDSPVSLFIDSLYMDKLEWSNEIKQALFYIVRKAKMLGIPVNFYAYCEDWKSLEETYSAFFISLLKKDCDRVKVNT